MWRYLIPFLFLGLAGPAWGQVDGTYCTPSSTVSGSFRTICVEICSEKDAADSSCAEYDVETLGVGRPYMIKMAIQERTACSGAAQAQLRGYDSTGASFPYTISGALVAVGGNESVTLVNPVHRFYDVVLSTMTACTDFTVTLELFYLRIEN